MVDELRHFGQADGRWGRGEGGERAMPEAASTWRD